MSKKKRREERRPRAASGDRGVRLLFVVGFFVALSIVVGAVAVSPAGFDVFGVEGSGGDNVLRAGIVDQLSLTAPNEDFHRKATKLLEDSGYVVEYVPGEEVTVDFYRGLPDRDYDLLILRVHSTAEISRGEEDVTSVSLFTGQDYDRDLYLEEQLEGRIGFAQYTEESPRLFGITSEFVRKSMEGEFDDTVVLMMGCQGFINAEGADAFAEKGARTFIGWDGLVSAAHTDEATELLLRHLVLEEQEPAAAIKATMDTVGPDPDYGSRLVARP